MDRTLESWKDLIHEITGLEVAVEHDVICRCDVRKRGMEHRHARLHVITPTGVRISSVEFRTQIPDQTNLPYRWSFDFSQVNEITRSFFEAIQHGLPPLTELERARCLHTASLWHSDRAGDGLALLGLSSTRKVQSVKHQDQILHEIATARASIRNDQSLDAKRLNELAWAVSHSTIGNEWLTHSQFQYLVETLTAQDKL
jgi:hypothetical protein